MTISRSEHSLPGKLLNSLLALRYKVAVKGLDTLDLDETKGTIFLPNHPALIDPVIVMSILYHRYRPRPLSAIEQVDKFFVRHAMHPLRPILLPQVHRVGEQTKAAVHRAINEVICGLKQGENILFYPAGRLSRTAREDLRGNSGLEYIFREVPDLQVVLIRTTGLWGSSFSHASGSTPTLTGKIAFYLRALLANGIFFMPKRQVTVELVKTNTLAQLGKRTRINGYLEAWYNTTSAPAAAVPYFWWQNGTPTVSHHGNESATERKVLG